MKTGFIVKISWLLNGLQLAARPPIQHDKWAKRDFLHSTGLDYNNGITTSFSSFLLMLQLKLPFTYFLSLASSSKMQLARVHLDVFCWLQLFPATFFVPIAESVKVRWTTWFTRLSRETVVDQTAAAHLFLLKNEVINISCCCYVWLDADK